MVNYYNSMKILSIIPARGNSKELPRKNIKSLVGKPLIEYSIAHAKKSQFIDRIIVSTDNKKIAQISKSLGVEVPFLRPKKLATDNATMDDVIEHAIKKLFSLGYSFEILVNRDCTVPFIHNKDVKGSINLLKKTKPDMVCGVYRQHHNPYFNMMELNQKGHLTFSKKIKKRITSRQNAPIVFQVNGLFVINVEQFLKYKRVYMPKILPYEISPESGFMIDTEFEFQIANAIVKNKIKT